MTVLLPRARLDLSKSSWDFLHLSETQKAHYQKLLDESELETRLTQKFGTLHTVTATDILPSASAQNLSSLNVDDVSIVILVSKHAAFLSKILLAEKLFEEAQCFSVGRASLKFFENIAIKTAASENAASLLELDELQQIRGLKTLIIKGEGGLDNLELGCQQRGADVRVMNLYQRQLAVNLDNEIASIDVQAVSSIYGVSVFALEHLLAGINVSTKTLLLQKELLAMSERIAKAAADMGFKRIRVDV